MPLQRASHVTFFFSITENSELPYNETFDN